jgi:hypothetical protein
MGARRRRAQRGLFDCFPQYWRQDGKGEIDDAQTTSLQFEFELTHRGPRGTGPVTPREARKCVGENAKTRNAEGVLPRRFGLTNLSPRLATGTAPPRPALYPNQGFIELGSWQAMKLRQRPTIHLYPWMSPPTSNSTPSEQPPVNRDPLALARFYQGLLDTQVVSTRAELARYLNVSRARVTQVLRRLRKACRQTDEGVA